MDEKKKTFFGLDVDDPRTPRKILLTVISIWAGSAILIALFFYGNFQNQGIFGDMFGAVNALFSGLAFAGIIYSILLQGEELKAQRQELQLNREEMKLTRKEFEAQNKTLRIQRIESTYITLLQNHSRYLKELSIPGYAGGSLKGNDMFRSLCSRVHTSISSATEMGDDDFDNLCKIYMNAIMLKESSIRSYLRSLDVPLRFIWHSEISMEEKKFYYSIALSQIQTDQFRFLEYHYAYYRTQNDQESESTIERLRLLLESRVT